VRHEYPVEARLLVRAGQAIEVVRLDGGGRPVRVSEPSAVRAIPMNSTVT